MSSLFNGVGNIKGTPAMLTDTLANRPDPEILAVGTIFIDSDTGNWYQVGTNNTWSSTGGGGGGTSNLQTVLDNGNQASEQTIYLTGLSNNLETQISNSDDAASYIQLRSLSDNNKFLKIQQSGEDQAPNITVNYTNDQYNSINYNYIEIYNNIGTDVFSGFLSWENNGIQYKDESTGKSIRNLQYQNTQEYRDLTNNVSQKIRAKTNNFHNQIIDIPRFSGTIATAELGNSNSINLTSSNYTVPTVTTQDFFIVTNGSGTNRIVLTTGLVNLAIYTFLNNVNNTSFTNNTGGTIYGLASSLAAGIIQVIRYGNDFYITHP